MLLPQRRATGRHRHRHLRQMQADHVRVPLNDQRVPGPRDRRLGPVEPVEKLRLAVDPGFRRVEVLRSVPIEQAGTETHRRPAQVVDRKHHPSAEPVTQPATLTPCRQTGIEHGLLGHSLVLEIADEGIPGLGGRISEHEAIHHLGLIAPTTQVLAGTGRIRCMLETIVIELDGLLDRLDQRLPLTASLRRLLIDPQRNPGPGGQELHRFGEIEGLSLLHELEDVPAGTTSETVIETTGDVDRHRGRLLLMERTDRLHRPTTLAHGGHGIDQIDDVDRRSNALDVLTQIRHRGRV